MSLDRVRANASKNSQNRKLDPTRFSGVKSKVGRNIKVINKQNVSKIKKKAEDEGLQDGKMS
jgi:hypothetical protein